MSNSIKVTKIESGFAVKFPFELKDSFKQSFKSAKWNAYEKQWEVGVRSEKKLNEWIGLVSGVAEEIQSEKDRAEESSLCSSDIESITGEITKIRAMIAASKSERKNFASSKETLEAAKKELDQVKQTLEDEKKKTTEAAAEAKKILGQVCDLDAICLAHSTMNKYHGKVGNGSKTAFNEAASIIGREYKRLKDAGFISKGLVYLYDCNHNRPDRDNPNSISYSDYFDLVKIEPKHA